MTAREVLEGFARGRVSRDQLERDLADYITVRFRSTERKVTISPEFNEEVIVRPEDVRSRLQSYLRGEIGADGLSEWASLILMIGAYTWPGNQFDESTPGERAWLILQELSAPQVHREISHASVHDMLKRLEVKGRNREPAA